MLRILHRYILSSVIASAASAIVFIAFIFAAANLLKDIFGFLLEGRLSLGLFLELAWLMLPFVAIYALPIGLLIGVLLTLGRLSADNEITSMRAAGLSIAQITRPILVLAVLSTVFGLYINFYAMPKARITYHEKLANIPRDTALLFLTPKTFIRDVSGGVLFFDKKVGDTMHNVWIWKLDKQQRVTHVIHAQTATLEIDPLTDELVLTPHNLTAETRNAENPERIGPDDRIGTGDGDAGFRFSLGKLFGRATPKRKIDWYTLPQLLEERQRVADQSPEVRMKVDLAIHENLTRALGIFAFTLIAIPLGIRTQRKESSANFGLAVLLVLSYYILSMPSQWLDKFPHWRPDLLMWLPTITFLVIGIWLFRRIEQTR